MRNKNIALSLLGLLIAVANIASAQDFKLPKYEKVKLPNGLTLYLMEQHEVPLISTSMVFPAGTIYEPAGKAGLAGVTADALMFGAGNRSKQQIEEELDFVGANLNTWANKETGNIYASFAKKDTDLVLGIIKDMLVKPQFNAEEWQKLQTRRSAEYDQMKESPRSVINDYYDAFVFAGHPYAMSSSGTKAGLESITTDDIRQFYQQYSPKQAAMAVVGDFNSKEMKKRVENLFKDWKPKTSAKPVKLEATSQPSSSRVLLVNKPDARETTFYIGGPGVKRSNPDYVSIQVLNTILGGRFTSWLNDELRVNSGLTYGARSSFGSFKEGGKFVISTFTKNESTEEAVDLALKTYGRMHGQGIDEATLESAKNYVQGQYPPRYETAGSLASLLTDMYWYGFDENFINTFQEKVGKLDVAEANRIANTYFPKENLQFVLIGKAEDLRELAKKWGEVTEKEITADGF
jgi:predicted Zn-dependent peptidase